MIRYYKEDQAEEFDVYFFFGPDFPALNPEQNSYSKREDRKNDGKMK